MTAFFRYVLRTSDVAGARAFYASVLGDARAEVVQLHEQAVMRGARPHWLGHIEVREVNAAAAAFRASGATMLGPKWVNPQGVEGVVLRDPGGAVLSLAKPARTSSSPGVASPEVAWHALNTTDVEGAKANYGELFGWEFKEPVDLGSIGVVHPFAWHPGGAPVGSFSDIATRPGVHPHWLFHFRVGALDSALEALRAGGGTALGPFVLPRGDRVAVCDDPHGAAFALFEERPATAIVAARHSS